MFGLSTLYSILVVVVQGWQRNVRKCRFVVFLTKHIVCLTFSLPSPIASLRKGKSDVEIFV